jgi:hypothetical protein
MHRKRPHHQQQQQEAKAENMRQKLHRETAEGREFVTAAVADDLDLAGAVEGRTPNLPTQMADIWPLYIAFLRIEFGNESAVEHWRLFCGWSAATAELEI